MPIDQDAVLASDPSRGDLEAIADLWVASWAEVMPHIDFVARRDWLLARLAAWPATIFLKHNGSLLGFATYDPASGCLDQIAVAAGSFGTGVGRRLLQAVKSACPQGVYLDVNTGNHRAIAFYRREGFVETGEGVNPNSGLKTISMIWTTEPPR
jgi:putative acetyltransferase